jgi:hypothetical protein
MGITQLLIKNMLAKFLPMQQLYQKVGFRIGITTRMLLVKSSGPKNQLKIWTSYTDSDLWKLDSNTITYF